MGRKRKSEWISQDDEIDLIDLTSAYGIDDEVPPMPVPPTPESNAKPGSSVSNLMDHDEYNNLQATFDFANAASQAAKVLNNASMSMQSKAINAQSTHQEVEVVDLGSDDDDRNSGSNEEYEVESILKRRWRYGIQYLVKWRGYPEEANTWEPESNLEGAKALIDQFEATSVKTLSSQRKKEEKLPVIHATELQQQSLGINEIIVPQSPKGFPSQTTRQIPREVGYVLACRLVPSGGSCEYLIQWKDHPVLVSWEPEERFTKAKRSIEDYEFSLVAHLPDGRANVTPQQAVEDREFSTDTRVIVCSRRNLESLNEHHFCIYHKITRTHSWVPGAHLASEAAQEAVGRFLNKSKIMREPLRRTVPSPPPTRAFPPRIPATRKVQEPTMSTYGRTEFLSLRKVLVSNNAPEIASVIAHVSRDGQSTEYLVRWKDTAVYTWLSTEDLYGFAGGITMTKLYQEDTERRLGQQAKPTRTSANGSNKMSLHSHQELAAQPTIAAPRTSYATPQSTLMEGRAQQFAGRNASKAGVITYRLGKGVPPKQSNASHEILQDSSLNRLNEAYNGDTPEANRIGTNIASILRRQALDGRTSQNLKTERIVRQTSREEEDWIEAHVTQTVPLLSEDEKTRIVRRVTGESPQLHVERKEETVHDFLRALAVRHLNSVNKPGRKPPSTPKPLLTQKRPQAGRDSIDSLSTASGSPRSKERYPKSDAFILMGKTDNVIRPLPNGRYNQHNVASNVLLAVGKHPWLPGLNHHLQGQLDRDESGRQINALSKQISRARELRTYEAPTTMSEITAANDRATLPKGGRPFQPRV